MTGATAWTDWLAVCGLKREATMWGGRAIAGGGRSDLLAERLEAEIAAQRPPGLISFGICGALDPSLAVGDIVVGESVATSGGTFPCDRAVRLADAAGGRLVRIVASDAPASDPQGKRLLSAQGEAADMESHVAARIARAHGLPLAVLRVVSDAADDLLPPAAMAGMGADGGVDIGAVLRSLARNPRQLPALIRMAQNADKAFARLKRARRALG